MPARKIAALRHFCKVAGVWPIVSPLRLDRFILAASHALDLAEDIE
jgi:hypothetical protein